MTVQCEATNATDGERCRRDALWVITHRKAHIDKRVCTQHQWGITTGNPKTDADLEKDTGWVTVGVVIDGRASRRAPGGSET